MVQNINGSKNQDKTRPKTQAKAQAKTQNKSSGKSRIDNQNRNQASNALGSYYETLGSNYPSNQYKTHEVASIIGVHDNTVRAYEKYELISKPERLANGYRVFTDLHVEQFRLARAALQVEVVQNGLRQQAVAIIKMTAQKEYDQAREMAQHYLDQIDQEIAHAMEAIGIAQQILDGTDQRGELIPLSLTRKQAAEYLNITIDTLRNWELNGLISVARGPNRYRLYKNQDINRLKLIRSLRCANYSLAAILRMLNALSHNPDADVKILLNTPKPDEDVISACDHLLTSLDQARRNMTYVVAQLELLIQL